MAPIRKVNVSLSACVPAYLPPPATPKNLEFFGRSSQGRGIGVDGLKISAVSDYEANTGHN